MNDTMKLGAAAVGGYVLGRTKKAKAAIGLAFWLAGRKRPADLARDQAVKLIRSDRGQDFLEELRGPVLSAGKQAAMSVFETQAGRLGDAMQRRTERLGGGVATKSRTRRDEHAGDDDEYDGDDDEQDDEYENEYGEDQDAEEDDDDEYENEYDEDEEDDDEEDDDEEDDDDEYENEYDESEDDDEEDDDDEYENEYDESEDDESEDDDEYDSDYDDERDESDEAPERTARRRRQRASA